MVSYQNIVVLISKQSANKVLIMNEYNTHLVFVSTKKSLTKIIIPLRGAFTFKCHGSSYDEGPSNSFGTSKGSFYEIWIEAASDQIAYEIADLLISAIAVVDFVAHIDLGFILHNLGFNDHSVIKDASTAVYWNDNLHSACMLVREAVSGKELEFALYKYFVAQEIYPIHPMDLDPMTDIIDRLYLPTIQTTIGNAVITSFSVLEELGLKKMHLKRNQA